MLPVGKLGIGGLGRNCVPGRVKYEAIIMTAFRAITVNVCLWTSVEQYFAADGATSFIGVISMMVGSHNIHSFSFYFGAKRGGRSGGNVVGD